MDPVAWVALKDVGGWTLFVLLSISVVVSVMKGTFVPLREIKRVEHAADEELRRLREDRDRYREITDTLLETNRELLVYAELADSMLRSITRAAEQAGEEGHDDA